MTVPSIPVLHTRRMTLSPCRPADCEDFIALERDPEVMRFLNGGRPVADKPADSNAPFLMPRGTEQYVWTARLTDEGRFAGWFCLWPESQYVAELGYRLRRDVWRQGLATEGAMALVDWGFNIAGYEQITANAMAAHKASRRVLEKTGFKYDHTEHAAYAEPFPGCEQGECWYGLRRSDWPGACHQL